MNKILGSLAASLSLCLVACQAKIQTSTSRRVGATGPTGAETTLPAPGASSSASGTGSEAPATHAEAVESKSAFAVPRTYVQTRSPIALAIAADVATAGDDFSIFNDSLSVALIADQTLALTDPTEYALSYAIVDAAPDLKLTLFPLDAHFAGKLGYGVNHLRLLAGPDGGQRYVVGTVTRADFPFVSVGGGSFSAATQRAAGLETHVGGAFQTSVTNGSSVLTVGKLSLLSQ